MYLSVDYQQVVWHTFHTEYIYGNKHEQGLGDVCVTGPMTLQEKTTNMKKLQKIICSAALMITAAGITNAATISYNVSNGPTLTDFNYSLQLPKFNPLLGNLTSATLQFNANDDILSLNLTNTSGANQTFKYTSSADFLLTGNTADSTLVGTDLAVTNFFSGLITLGPSGSGACPVATPSSSCNNVSYAPPSVSTNTGAISIATLANYISSLGNTNFTLSGNTLTSSTFTGGGGNISSAQVTYGTASAIVTYNYDAAATPEPATLGLMGAALLALGMF